MAKTAVVTLAPSSVTINAPINCVVTITNGDGSDVQVRSVQPTAIATGAGVYAAPVGLGQVDLGPNENLTVTASGGTLALPFSVVFFGPSATTYTVGALIQLSDGTNVSASTATVDVNALS